MAQTEQPLATPYLSCSPQSHKGALEPMPWPQKLVVSEASPSSAHVLTIPLLGPQVGTGSILLHSKYVIS